jgi:hypothetical protein
MDRETKLSRVLFWLLVELRFINYVRALLSD